MAAFISFLVAIAGCALFLMLAPEKSQRYWGIAGLLSLGVFLTAAFSFDSLALPNMWVVFGLITAAAWVYTQSETTVEKGVYRAGET